MTKEGYTTFSAIHLHPRRAQQLIREGAERAVRRVANAKPWRLAPGSRVEIGFDHQARVEGCLAIPSVERAGERTIAFAARDALVFNGRFRAVMQASDVRFSP